MMKGREIGERFIRAVEISEGWYSDRPGGGGSAWVAYPYTQADKNGWGTERLAEERRAFWSELAKSPKPWEVTEAEQTLSWLDHIKSEAERRCLMGWARCMASNIYFKDWCKDEGIHPETGRRRKERAILRILLALDCNVLQHNEIDVSALLPDEPEMGDKNVIIGEGATNWIAEHGRPMACDFDSDLGNFDWATKQNERRRQREAKKREKQAA